MNNFEKRFFLECFEKLLPTMSFLKDSFDELLDLYIKEFNINQNLFEKFYDEDYLDYRILRKKENRLDLIKIIKSNISMQLKKNKTTTCLLEHQLSYFFKLYHHPLCAKQKFYLGFHMQVHRL